MIPTFAIHVHATGGGPVAYVLLGLAFFACKCMAADLSHLEETLGDAVLVALTRAHITIKEACAVMGTDESQFSKALRGENYRHIALDQLIKLPYSFWLHFAPALVYLVAKRNTVEIAETLGLKRAS